MEYTALAPVYDKVMHHVRYERWVALVKRVARRYASGAQPEILEIGGGTGVLARKLRHEGFALVLSDRSPAMCRQAREKLGPVVCADGRALPISHQFDMAVFLYDGINYLCTRQDYAALFTEVHRVLRPDGLFLFDITTEANSIRHFSDILDFEEVGDYTYVRHSYYRPREAMQHNDFVIFRRRNGEERGVYERFDERHRQKLFAPGEIREMIPPHLFSVEGIWDGYSFHPWHPSSERIHFLLRKAA